MGGLRGALKYLWRGGKASGDGEAPVQQDMNQLGAILSDVIEQTKTTPTQTRAEAVKRFWGWQYAAVCAIADSLMMIPPQVQQRKGDEWENAPDHPLAELLHRVNPVMTRAELVHLTVQSWVGVGDAFWKKVRTKSGAGPPLELWPLPAQNLKPIRDEEFGLGGWKLEVTIGGKRHIEEIKPENIVHFTMPSMTESYMGFGTLRASGGQIKIAEQILDAQYNAFKNGVLPLALLYMAEQDPEKRRTLLREFNSLYQSTTQAGQTIALEMDKVTAEFPGRTPQEMGFVGSTKIVRDSILGSSRVPEAIIGLSENVNRAVAFGMEYIWAKWRLSPLLTMMQERMNQDLSPDFGDDVRVIYDSPVPADKEFELKKNTAMLKGGVILINEWRAQDGLEPKPWGNRPWMPVNLLPVGASGEPGEGEQMLKLIDAEGDVLLLQAPKATSYYREMAAKKGGYTKRERAVIGAMLQRARIRLEAAFARSYRRMYGALAREAKRKLKVIAEFQGLETQAVDWDAIIDDIWKAEEIGQEMYRRGRPFVASGMLLAGQLEHELAGGKLRGWTLNNPAAKAYMEEFSEDYFKYLSKDQQGELRSLVAKATGKGKTFAEIREALEDHFDMLTQSRAGTIVTTETTKILGAGGQAFREHYDLVAKQWLCSFVNSRDTHQAGDGQIVANNVKFKIGADEMMYPGQGTMARENAFCNCGAVAAPLPNAPDPEDVAAAREEESDGEE